MRCFLLSVCFAGLVSAVLSTDVSLCHETIEEDQYEGCFEDQEDRVLNGDFVVFDTTNSATQCISYCANKGFKLAGTEWYKECFCGNEYRIKVPKDEGDCNTPCTGGQGNCGGGWRLKVYRTAGVEEIVQRPTLKLSESHIGCLEDNPSRVLQDEFFQFDDNSIEKCIRSCYNAGYKYAGVQYYKECFCGIDLVKKIVRPESECNTKCAGSNDMCGGGWRMNVFDASVAALERGEDGVYLGCFVDDADRIFKGAAFQFGRNSRAFCKTVCDQLGYAYAGVEYHTECYCGNALRSKDKRPESECDSPCSGNNEEICGGGWRLSVFLLKDTHEENYKDSYKGCFEDAPARVLPHRFVNHEANSPKMCMKTCNQAGFAYAGVEYAYECFCGNEFNEQTSPMPETDCNSKCTGTDEPCGGGWRLSVYSTTDPSTYEIPGIDLGCFEDAGDRVLSSVFVSSDINSQGTCNILCAQQGYIYAGVQYSSECFCGNEMKRIIPKPAAECNMPCTGNENEVCGGGWRMNVAFLQGRHHSVLNGGEPFNITEGCDECGCRWRDNRYHMYCSAGQCPPMICPENLQETIEGQCCPVCRAGCYVDGKLYEAGENIPNDDRCLTCSCEGSVESGFEPMCAAMACHMGMCEFGHIDDGSCCGQCKECPDECPALNCKKKDQYQNDGMCCPMCLCKHDGKTFEQGPFEHECKSCVCTENGDVSCVSQCTKVMCVDPVEDGCCFSCPNGKTCMTPGKKPEIIMPDEIRTIGKKMYTCLDKKWHPEAFAVPKKVNKNVIKNLKAYKDVMQEW